MRLEKEDITNIEKLTKSGKSIRYIAKEMGLNLTTVYYYTRKINGLQRRQPNFTNLNANEIGEIIGAFAGDGSYYYSSHGRSGHHIVRFHFNLENREYISYFENLLEKTGLNVFKCITKYRNSLDLKVNSKKFIKFIREYLNWNGKKTYSVHLKFRKCLDDHDLQVGILRGLIRTDGHIRKDEISFFSTSKKLAKDLSRILDMLMIRYDFRINNDKRINRKTGYVIRMKKENAMNCLKLLNGATQI